MHPATFHSFSPLPVLISHIRLYSGVLLRYIKRYHASPVEYLDLQLSPTNDVVRYTTPQAASCLTNGELSPSRWRYQATQNHPSRRRRCDSNQVSEAVYGATLRCRS